MRDKITGIMVYYYFVCKRKLWYFTNSITMEHTNENVAIGKAIDEHKYSKELKHLSINDEINIDFIADKKVVHEVKKSSKIEEASIWQVKYYLYYLKSRGITDITGRIDYPTLRKSTNVELTQEDLHIIEDVVDEIKILIANKLPPPFKKRGICRNCAYNDMRKI